MLNSTLYIHPLHVLTDSDVETEQVSQCVNSGSEQALIPSHHLPSQRENNMGVQTNESTEQESKSASHQASQPTSQPTSQPDSQQSASNIQHQVADIDCKLANNTSTVYRQVECSLQDVSSTIQSTNVKTCIKNKTTKCDISTV